MYNMCSSIIQLKRPIIEQDKLPIKYFLLVPLAKAIVINTVNNKPNET
jgi:hypothetical protein